MMIPVVNPIPRFRIGALCGVLLALGGPAPFAFAESSRLTALTEGFSAAVARLEERYQPLNEGYRNALTRLQESVVSAGNLDHALAVKAELEAFAKTTDHDEAAFQKRLSDWAELSRLQNTYLEQRRVLDRQIDPALRDLARRFDEELGKLQVELTKAGSLGEAVEVKDAQELFRGDPRYAAYFGGDASGGTLIRGKLHFVTKGELELYHNGKAVSYRDLYEGSEAGVRVTGESRGADDFRVGDLLVIRGRSSAVFRGIAVAMAAEDKSAWIPVPPSRLRYLGTGVPPETVTKESAESVATGGIDTGGTDAVMLEQWEQTGLPVVTAGGSLWFRGQTANEWHVWALILTPEMKQILKKEP